MQYKLEDFILFGIQEYCDNHLLERNESLNNKIERIKTICTNEKEEEKTEDQIILSVNEILSDSPQLKKHIDELIRFFNSTRDNLKLVSEDIYNLEVFLSRNQDILNKYRPTLSDSISPSNISPNKENNEEIQKLSLEEQLAIKFHDFLSVIKKKESTSSIENEIDSLIDNHLDDLVKQSEKKEEVKKNLEERLYYIKSYKSLKSYKTEAEDKIWDKLPAQRLFKQKSWNPDKKTEVGKNVVLLVHGLDDSSRTWETQARILAKKGYTVLSYDQAGHGVDQLVILKKPLNLKLMQYDLYQQIKTLQENEHVETIHLVGHSAGGTLLCNSMATIHATPKIKSVTCISPAIMASPNLDLLQAYPTTKMNPGDKEVSVSLIRGKGITGFGGPGVKNRLSDFKRFVSRGFKNAEALVSGNYLPKKKDPLSWEFISGKDDKLIRSRNFNLLKKIKGVINVTIRLIKNGHHPHGPGSSTGEFVGELLVDHIERSMNASSIKEKLKSAEVTRKMYKDIQDDPIFKELQTEDDFFDAQENILTPIVELYIGICEEKERLEREVKRGNLDSTQLNDVLSQSNAMTRFTDKIIKEYQAGYIKFQTLIELNRAVHPNENLLPITTLKSEITKYEQKREKGIFSREAQTIKDIKELENMSGKNYRHSDIELITKLRDARTSTTFFRQGTFKNNSLTLFKQSKENTLKQGISLTPVEQAISNLAKVK